MSSNKNDEDNNEVDHLSFANPAREFEANRLNISSIQVSSVKQRKRPYEELAKKEFLNMSTDKSLVNKQPRSEEHYCQRAVDPDENLYLTPLRRTTLSCNEPVESTGYISPHMRCHFPDTRYAHSYYYTRVVSPTAVEEGNIIPVLLAKGFPGSEMDAAHVGQIYVPKVAYTPTKHSYTEEENVILLKLIINEDGENVPNLLLLRPDDYPTGVIVLSNQGILNMSYYMKSTLKDQGITALANRLIAAPK